jgi:anti-sigma factor RsiW
MMNEPVPNDGVSAYFDEELSSAEHDAVSHHLSQSAAAKTELAEIRRLSEELRNLPAESTPHAVHSQVMNLLADRRARAGGGGFSRSIILAGKWLAAAAAVGLLVSLFPSFWNSPHPAHSPDTLAARSSEAEQPNQSAESFASKVSPAENAAKRANRVMLGSEAELLPENQMQRSFANSDGDPKFSATPATTAFGGMALPEAIMRPSADVSDALVSRDKSEATDPLLARIRELSDRQADRVVVVEVVADDLEQALGRLQVLLAENAVVPANFQLSQAPTPLASGGRKQAEENMPRCLFVQALPQQLSPALAELRQRNLLSQSQPQTSLALRGIPALDDLESRSKSGGFADRYRQTLEQSLQKYEAGQGMRRLGGIPDGGSKKPAADLPKAEKLMTPPPAPSEGSPAPPGIAAPDGRSFKLQGDLAASPKPAAKADSFQMVVQTPTDQGANKELDSKAFFAPAETKPGEGKSEPSQTGAAQAVELAEEETAPLAIRVMFIFRQKPAPSSK